MEQQVVSYITSCRAQGFDDAAIRAELRKAGYDEKIISAAFRATEAVMPPPPDVPTIEHSPRTAKKSSFKTWLVAFVLVILVLAIGGLVWSQRDSALLQSLQFWQVPPYETDGELSLGFISSLSQLPDAPVSSRSTLAIELMPQAPGETVTVYDELRTAAELVDQSGSGFLPSEGHLRIAVDSKVDARTADAPLIDVTASADLLFEPFIATFAGATKYVDNTLYARIDDIPALLEPGYRQLTDAPLGTWLLVGTRDQLESGVESSLDPLVPSIVSQRVGEAGAELATMQQLLEMLPATPNQSLSNLASIYNSGVTFFDDVDESRVYELLETHPMLTTSGSPERVSTTNGTIYRYNVRINDENLRAFLEAVPSSITDPQRRAEVEAKMKELREELRDMSALDEFYKYYTTYLDVNARGRVVGFLVSGAITDHPESPNKLVVTVQVTIDSIEPFTVVAPSDVHPGSLVERITEQQRQRSEEIDTARLKLQLSNLRSAAELYYNDNQFAYDGVCAHFLTLPFQSNEALDCTDTEAGYRASVPMNSGFYCVDSTGFAMEVAAEPTGVTCQPVQ